MTMINHDEPKVPEALVNMMKGQLATNGIQDERVRHALTAIDRADFVPENYRQVAYVDEDIPLCRNRFLLEPLIFAKMLTYAEIAPGHKVLDIGAGLGYSSAVIATLAEEVIAVEESAELVAIARKKLSSAGIREVDLVTAPLTIGCSAHQPYDRIIVEGVVRKVPAYLEEQLADGGKIIAIVACSAMFATQKTLGNIIIGTKHSNVTSYVERERVSAYPLHQLSVNEEFTF